MYKLSGKHKKVFNSLLLGFYFLFLISAIFHSHSIDFNSQIDFSNYNTPIKIVDPFLDGKANCALAHFFQSQILRCDCSNNVKFLLSLEDYCSPLYSSIKIHSPFLKSLKLRAPPQLFS